MVDLVEKFFTQDLSEAEQEALSQYLERSPEAALNYERLLEQNYLATGLPQPMLPKSLQSLPRVGGGGLAGGSSWVPMTLAGLVVAGIALWKFWPPTKAEISTPVQKPMVQQAHVKKIAKKPTPIQPLAAGPAQEGQELSVVVSAPQRSLVTVRILDAQGREVRALFTGFVESGRWSFQWDGLLENGEPASAGDYLIDVQSGASRQSKNIHIKVQPVAP